MSKPVPLEDCNYYHIYNRGNGGENIFREQRNYPYFMKLYAKYIAPVAQTYAYCLLRNHFHLLVKIREKETCFVDQTNQTCQVSKNQTNQTCQVSKNLTGLRYLNPTQQFSNFFNAYTKSINASYGRTGNLFQRPFGRIRVTRDQYFAYLIQYIHFNPQKHGFVEDFCDYPYSSYNALVSDKPTELEREAVLGWFSGRASFIAEHQSPYDEKRIIKLIEEDL